MHKAPKQTIPKPPRQISVIEKTDALTLIAPDPVGGLEVQTAPETGSPRTARPVGLSSISAIC